MGGCAGGRRLLRHHHLGLFGWRQRPAAAQSAQQSVPARIDCAAGQFSGPRHAGGADRYLQPNAVFRNQGDGTFDDASPASGPPFTAARAHRGLVVADLDGDGRPDAVVSVLGGKPEVWRNVSSGGAHWLDLKLIGTRSNRDAIGAMVRAGNQWNHQTSGAGYASSSLVPVHFGLGTQTIMPKIEITWPSGAVQELRGVKVDQILTVREPDAPQLVQ